MRAQKTCPLCCTPIDVTQSAEGVLRDDLPPRAPRSEHCRIAPDALASDHSMHTVRRSGTTNKESNKFCEHYQTV
jgi:hypothetical protein